MNIFPSIFSDYFLLLKITKHKDFNLLNKVFFSLLNKVLLVIKLHVYV